MKTKEAEKLQKQYAVLTLVRIMEKKNDTRTRN